MKPLAVWSSVCAVLCIAVVNAAPRSYRHEAYASALRVKRQDEVVPETTINNCGAEMDWPVECATCPEATVMQSDNYACLACSQFCMSCDEDPMMADAEGMMMNSGSTTCKQCNGGYLLSLDTLNNTVCVGCASYCTGCMVKGECDSDKCEAKSTGQGTIFDVDTKTCKSCASNCMSCSVSGECAATACFDSYAYSATTKQCDVCPDFCMSCSYVGTTLMCSACSDLYAVNADSTGCSACPDNCLECETDSGGSVMCKTDSCQDRYVLETGSCNACSDFCTVCTVSGFCDADQCDEGYGYIQDGTNNYGICSECPAKCSTCTPDADGLLLTCDQCMVTFMLTDQPTCDFCPDNCNDCSISSSGGTVCKSTGCDSGYAYRSSDGTCQMCPANCNTCSWNTASSITKCNSGSTGCESGYAQRSADGKCYKCSDNCDKCTDNGAETQCDYGFCAAGSAYKALDKTCPSCPSDCSTCLIDQNENVVCTMCNDMFVETDDSLACVNCPSNCLECEYDTDTGSALCFDQQCSDHYYRNSAGSCVDCEPGCKSCYLDSSTSVTVCTECFEYYAMNSAVTPITCNQCSNCAGTCTWDATNSRAECGTCAQGYALDTVGSCNVCPDGCKTCTTTGGSQTCSVGGCDIGYAQIASDSCVLCPEGCSACSLKTSGSRKNHIDCDSGNCMTGYVEVSGKCLKCPDKCNTCIYTSSTSTTTCSALSCQSSYMVDSGVCKACQAGCTVCNTNGAGKCDSSGCPNTHIYDSSTLMCSSCASNCEACTTTATCDGSGTCAVGFKKKADSTGCEGCPSNCDVCSTTIKCTTCMDGYVKKETSTDQHECVACPSNCKFCSYTSGEAQCVWGQCDPGYLMDANRQCQTCPTGCASCEWDSGATKCYMDGCRSGYVQKLDTTCAVCPTYCNSCYLDGSVTKCNPEGCEKDKFQQSSAGACTDACDTNCASGCIVKGNGKCDTSCDNSKVLLADFTCGDCVTGCSVGGCTTTNKCDAAGSTCIDGYYKNGDTCVACDDSACSGDGNCVACATCSTGVGVCDSCNSGSSFDDPNNLCVACDTNCASGCIVKGADKCDTTCDNSKVLLADFTCGDCVTGCSVGGCTITNKCDAGGSTCIDGYYMSTDTCVACDDSACSADGSCVACATCSTGVGACDSCDPGSSFDDPNNKCVACTAGCASCDITDGAVCLTCNDGYALVTDACTECTDTNCAKCPDGVGVCSECEATHLLDSSNACVVCTVASNCLTCNADTPAVCNDCPSGRRLNSGTFECDPCDDATYCENCDGSAATCETCASTHMLVSGVCELMCTAANQYITDGGTCVSATDTECVVARLATTSSASGEDKCYTNYCAPESVYNADSDSCVACPAGCFSCYINGGSTVCLFSGCERYYGRSSDGSCTACPIGCDQCSYDAGSLSMMCDDTKCTSTHEAVDALTCVGCHYGCDQCSVSVLNEVKCSSSQCSDLYTQITTDLSCFPNPSNCKTGTYMTTNDGSFSTCNVNQCSAGYAMNTADSTCHICSSACMECTYSSTAAATVCNVEKCNDGNAQNPSDFSCEPCPDNCAMCVYDSSMANNVRCLEGGCAETKREYMVGEVVTCGNCLANCDNCEADASGLNTLCLDQQCEVGFGITALQACTSCSDGCNECTIASDGTQICDTCKSDYIDNGEGLCAACPDNCMTCTYDSVNSVTTCTSGACASGYAQNTGASDLGCVACPDQCSLCSYDTSTSSTSCEAGNCAVGYANSETDGTCGACGSNCMTCSTAGVGLCDTCDSGYRVSSDKLCEKCSSFCSKCTSAGKGKCDSSSCDDTYTLDDNKECKTCSSNCMLCNSNGPAKCDTNQCNDEYAYADTTQMCISCPDNCFSCTVAEDGTTTQCVDTQCYPGYGRKSTDLKCHDCPNNCLTCEDTNLDGVLQCTACSQRFILNSGVCGACPIHCQACSYVAEFGLQCSACQDGFTFDTSNNCMACPAFCSQCTYDATTSATMCVNGMCDSGYGKADGGTCSKCSSLVYTGCSLCTDTMTSTTNSTSTASNSMCLECMDDYIMADDNSACLTCEISTSANCETCFDRPGTQCTECDSGFLVSKSEEICGVSCYQCMGDDCAAFSANNMDTEVCEACWVIQDTVGTTETTMRGCFSNSTCSDTYTSEMCEEVDGFTQCKRCCTGTNCNSFDLTGAASTVTSGIAALILLLAVQLF
jgi:hypothetical protein